VEEMDIDMSYSGELKCTNCGEKFSYWEILPYSFVECPLCGAELMVV
jgi:DNA-directed RNA polymerase subunit RPC12/RpoP